MTHHTLRGKILYTSLKPERSGAERGREYFSITRQRNGHRVLLSHTEIDDAPNVLRDVMLSLDGDWQPIDCCVRLTVGDQYEGTGFMRFDGDVAECETFNRRDGRISQRLRTEGRVRWLGAHPTVADGLGLSLYDLSRGPGREFFPNLMLTSPDHRGATGPMLFRLGWGLEFVGREHVTVGAGSFDALHFRYTDTKGQLPDEHPVYDVWCTEDGQYTFLKAQAGGYMQTAYELVELTQE